MKFVILYCKSKKKHKPSGYPILLLLDNTFCFYTGVCCLVSMRKIFPEILELIRDHNLLKSNLDGKVI